MRECEAQRQFTNYGRFVQLLERELRDKLHVDDSKAVICVCNATAALYALTEGIAQVNRVEHPRWATQSFTFPSSAQGMLAGSDIVDIDEGGGLDLSQVPSSCCGIIVTNVFGNVVDISKYVEWAEAHCKFLVFDNAATPYTEYKGKNSCNYGHGCVISFHHTKPIGYGEGGAIVVDQMYEDSVRALVNFGIGASTGWNPAGSNYKMSEIAAIYILEYFKQFERILDYHTLSYWRIKHTTAFEVYPNCADVGGKCLVSCICFMDDRFDGDYIADKVSHGIHCRKYYKPLADTPIAARVYRRILCYPLHCDIDVVHLE